jgi:hypothetical protein
MLLQQTIDARLIGGNPGLPCVGMEVEETRHADDRLSWFTSVGGQAFQGGRNTGPCQGETWGTRKVGIGIKLATYSN